MAAREQARKIHVNPATIEPVRSIGATRREIFDTFSERRSLDETISLLRKTDQVIASDRVIDSSEQMVRVEQAIRIEAELLIGIIDSPDYFNTNSAGIFEPTGQGQQICDEIPGFQRRVEEIFGALGDDGQLDAGEVRRIASDRYNFNRAREDVSQQIEGLEVIRDRIPSRVVYGLDNQDGGNFDNDVPVAERIVPYLTALVAAYPQGTFTEADTTQIAQAVQAIEVDQMAAIIAARDSGDPMPDADHFTSEDYLGRVEQIGTQIDAIITAARERALEAAGTTIEGIQLVQVFLRQMQATIPNMPDFRDAQNNTRSDAERHAQFFDATDTIPPQIEQYVAELSMAAEASERDIIAEQYEGATVDEDGIRGMQNERHDALTDIAVVLIAIAAGQHHGNSGELMRALSNQLVEMGGEPLVQYDRFTQAYYDGLERYHRRLLEGTTSSDYRPQQLVNEEQQPQNQEKPAE